jgi:hypothetical protein
MVGLTTTEDIKQFALGSDSDLGRFCSLPRLIPLPPLSTLIIRRTLTGGKSTVNFDLGPESKGRFWGTLSSQLREGRWKEGVIERGGYAGMRTKVC